MMTLFDIARSQDTEVFRDTYGSSEFHGQVQLFNESVRSGPSARRRIIETAPDVVIPVQRTVTEVETGEIFVLAYGSYDWYRGMPITAKYPVLPVATTFSIKSVEQVLSGAAGITPVYAEPSYIRRVILEDQSDYPGGYEMLYSSYFHPIPSGRIFISSGGLYYRTRENSRRDDIGFGVSEVVELTDPIKTLAYYSNTSKYVPGTDAFTGVTPVNVTAFVEPLALDYRHEVLGYVKIEAGDLAVSVLKSAVTALRVGDKIGTYTVLSVESVGNTWMAHARRNH